MNGLLLLSKTLGFLSRKILREDKIYFCPICENHLSHFNRLPDHYIEMMDKYGYIHSLFNAETLNYLKYACPICGASDRNRLCVLYLKGKLELSEKTGKPVELLDIAPDTNLHGWLKKVPSVHHRSMDLYMSGVDDKLDITDMSAYEKDKFDVILCSHVLEHVEDDIKAMGELYRVLKPGGFAIVMVPILLTLDEDLQNSKWVSESDRWKYYGQGDHVRMYSKKGFVSKLEQRGFRVKQLGEDHFGAEVFEKHGIHRRSVLYVAGK